MNELTQDAEPPVQAAREPGSDWPDLGGVWSIFRWLVVAATAWFLLKELAPLLRPLSLAILLAYVILPVHVFVRGQTQAGIGHLVLMFGVGSIAMLLGFMAYRDIADLSHELPQLDERAQALAGNAAQFADRRIPWLTKAIVGTASAEEQGANRLREALEGIAHFTASASLETIQVVFFLLLILVEARSVPDRVRMAFADQSADRILDMIRNVNGAIARYLKVKVRVNVALAVPAMLVLSIFGVRYVVLWGVLTFFANFVPYLGSMVACGLPILYAFLTLDFGWQPVALALLLIAVHGSSAYLVEPSMTGKAVNLSPLVVLIALSFWSLCWGLVGMVLAVPLTMMLKIVLESTPSTRPVALLMEEQ